MAAIATVIAPLPGVGSIPRLTAWLRGLLSRRLLLRLAGIEAVVLEGRVHAVRAVPLGVARDLVPAIIRCSRRFAAWDIDEELYDDMVTVLALGLGAPRDQIERLTISLWDLGPVIERIARANGLPMLEGEQGKALAALMTSTGTSSTPSSSAPPAGPGTTSTTT